MAAEAIAASDASADGLQAFLDPIGLSQPQSVRNTLISCGYTSVDLACKACEASRTSFLSQLKTSGVTKLGDRQALANALSRARRNNNSLPPKVDVSTALPPPPPILDVTEGLPPPAAAAAPSQNAPLPAAAGTLPPNMTVRQFREHAAMLLNGTGLTPCLERLKARGVTLRRILDVGAHKGTWTQQARRSYPEAHFVLVEPIEFEELRAFDDVHHALLYSHEAEVDWYEKRNSGLLAAEARPPQMATSTALLTLCARASRRG